MHQTSLRLIPLLCIVQLTCLTSCQWPGHGWGRRTESAAEIRQDGQRLTERQVEDVQLSLARSLELRGEIEPAMKAYHTVIEKSPKQPTGYWRLAVLHDRQGRLHESERLYRQALQLDPNNGEIHCDYGYNLYLQRRWAEADGELQRAIAIQPGSARAHNNLGLLLAQTERFDAALREFRLAGCNESDAYANLAFISVLNQNWDHARKQYSRALNANPNSVVARAGVLKMESLATTIGVDANTDGSFMSLAGATTPETLTFPSPR